jgi:hypothetical protein
MSIGSGFSGSSSIGSSSSSSSSSSRSSNINNLSTYAVRNSVYVASTIWMTVNYDLGGRRKQEVLA